MKSMTRLKKMTVAGKEVVHTREVSCSDGDHPLVYYRIGQSNEVTCGEAEDHPLVYYVIGKTNEVTCGYCNKTFVYVGTQPKA